MNPYQSPSDLAACPNDSFRPDDLEHLRTFTGNYYRVLGWISSALNIASLLVAYWTDFLHIDLSFMLWFWLGNSLKSGSPAARKWAIGTFVVVSIFAIAGFMVPDVKARLGPLRFDKSHPVFFVMTGFIWLVFAIPGIALIGRRGRAAFAGSKTQVKVGA
jgi:hypothetical protein